MKSYNERRGFGFVACAETAAKYGRDVYIAKAEAQLIGAEISAANMRNGWGRGAPGRVAADKQLTAGLAEEDFIRFHVRLSAEGFPQAERIQRVRKYHGTVVRAPALEGEESGDPALDIGCVASDELSGMFAQREVLVRRAACGQARLAAGDRVTFCIRSDAEGPPQRSGGGQKLREAQILIMAPMPQQTVGSVLGCFVLSLPRAALSEGWPARPDLHLDCHALGDRIIISGLPHDADENELMRFFVKQGSTGATVARSRGSSFASIAFPTTAEVSKFVARTTHTFADDKETRLARLLPHRTGCSAVADPLANTRLPGLPAPALAPGTETGVLFVTWSPVVLARGYVVELRPAGVQAQWSMVDASDGHLGSDSGRFGRECSSCKVSGLPSNVVFEARVTYVTSCGCCSDASDPSDWCVPCPTASPLSVGNNMGAQLMAQVGVAGGNTVLGCGAGGNVKGWSYAPMAPQQFLAPFPDAWQGAWQVAAAAKGLNVGIQPGVSLAGYHHMAAAISMPVCSQSPGWRCPHGTINPPPSMPELRPDGAGFAILVQWPSVAHANAYVVELRESGSERAERFIRSVPMQALGSLVELRIGGLRPGGSPGHCYVAQVRCVAACGCESEPSPPAVSQPTGAAMAPVAQLPPNLSLAAACALPGCATTGPCSRGASLSTEHTKLGAQWEPPCSPKQGLPNLLSSRLPLVPPPAGPAPMLLGSQKGTPPEVAGNEEDCIILD